MTSTAPLAGSLQMAAALVFHLPGARLELTGPSGRRCSVGPMTDPRCTLHPAEFREMVLASGSGRLLGTLLGFALVDEPTMTLTSSGVDTDHLGGGLYRVVGREFTSFAFTTPLEARLVDSLLSTLPAVPAVASRGDRADEPCEDEVAMCVSLVRDDGLGVTLVVISPFDADEVERCEAVARATVSACLVAEMEHFSACLDEAPPNALDSA